MDEITRLRAEVEKLRQVLENTQQARVLQGKAITDASNEIERLRAALREAYEVYAGSDGFIPETAGEGYQQQIIRQMVNCISAALEGK